MRTVGVLALVSLVVGVAGVGFGCGGDDDGAVPTSATSSSGSAGGGGEGGGGLPPPICNTGSKWSPGTQAFRDSSAAWGLDTLGAEGVRLAAVDFDNDGWTDLIVRKGGVTPDDFAAGGKRQTWLLRNNGKGSFEDVTIASKIRQNRTETDPNKGRPGEVFAFADVDNDGDLDVFTGLTGDSANPLLETSEVLLNNGDGSYSLGPEASELRVSDPRTDTPAGASFVDFNRDGVVDLWITQNSVDGVPQQDRLYAGDGTGMFYDVTTAQGLKTKAWSAISDLNGGLSHSNAWSALACDLNGDGNPELLAASYGRAPNLLWQASGAEAGFAFSNRAVDSGYAFDQRTDWSDNESARCWCKLHPSDPDCDGVPPPQNIACNVDADAFRWDHSYDREPFRLGGNSGGTSCADLDNDGDMDLVTSEIVHWDVGSSADPAEVLLNTGESDVRFERPGRDAMGINVPHKGVDWNEGIITNTVFDFDNDGWADLYFGGTDYPGNFGLLYHQESAGQFVSVPVGEGIDQHRSHGSAVADFDRDGDLDIVVGHSFARCDAECYATQQVRLFENVLGQNGNFVQLSLHGEAGANRSAIGARVVVTAGGVTQTKEVGGGYGHYGAQDELVLTFGLGDACEADVSVRWPDAALTIETMQLPAGYRFDVTKGQPPTVNEAP